MASVHVGIYHNCTEIETVRTYMVNFQKSVCTWDIPKPVHDTWGGKNYKSLLWSWQAVWSLPHPHCLGLFCRSKSARSTMSLTFPSFSYTACNIVQFWGQRCFHSLCHAPLKPCAKEDEMVMSCWSTSRCCSNSWHPTCLCDLVTTLRLL